MTISLISINSVEYNAYNTNQELDDYLAADIQRSAIWAALSEDQQNIANVTSTRRLDRLQWLGTKTLDTQPLQWPRDGVPGVDDGTTPQEVFDAHIILAADLQQNPQLGEQTTSSNIRAVGAGPARVEFFRPQNGPILPLIFQELISQYLAARAVVIAPFASGVSGRNSCSEFSDIDPYETVEGYK